jgi:putative endonuclease
MKSFGNSGETAVALELLGRGYTVTERQWRCRYGEIDLIVRDEKNMLCFVEVKLRTDLTHGLPREYVSPSKQRKIRQAASMYMSLHDLDESARFDVAEVYREPGGLRVVYLENAFE